MINRRWHKNFLGMLYSHSKKFSMVLSCIVALCCFFITSFENSSFGDMRPHDGKDTADAPTYVCRYNSEELKKYAFFGGRDYAASHLAIKCAMGAVAGSSVGAKFGGVLGAASGAAAGCYLFANAIIPLEGLLYSLDSYIGLTPTPLDVCNDYCKNEGPDKHCKEVKNDK